MGNKSNTKQQQLSTRTTIQMKANFATAAIAATYLALSAQGQNFFRFLDDTCEVEAKATS